MQAKLMRVGVKVGLGGMEATWGWAGREMVAVCVVARKVSYAGCMSVDMGGHRGFVCMPWSLPGPLSVCPGHSPFV